MSDPPLTRYTLRDDGQMESLAARLKQLENKVGVTFDRQSEGKA